MHAAGRPNFSKTFILENNILQINRMSSSSFTRSHHSPICGTCKLQYCSDLRSCILLLDLLQGPTCSHLLTHKVSKNIYPYNARVTVQRQDDVTFFLLPTSFKFHSSNLGTNLFAHRLHCSSKFHPNASLSDQASPTLKNTNGRCVLTLLFVPESSILSFRYNEPFSRRFSSY